MPLRINQGGGEGVGMLRGRRVYGRGYMGWDGVHTSCGVNKTATGCETMLYLDVRPVKLIQCYTYLFIMRVQEPIE